MDTRLQEGIIGYLLFVVGKRTRQHGLRMLFEDGGCLLSSETVLLSFDIKL